MLPFGLTENMPGSVPLGIQENDTRLSITRKNGRSGAFFTALTGKSAACAKPAVASIPSDSSDAAIALKRNDILNTPKFGHAKMNVPWVRHLRRLSGVRSLNFFQGMPLVSA